MAAFSLGTFFVAVDKESASPVGANTHCQQPLQNGKEEEKAEILTSPMKQKQAPQDDKLSVAALRASLHYALTSPLAMTFYFSLVIPSAPLHNTPHNKNKKMSPQMIQTGSINE